MTGEQRRALRELVDFAQRKRLDTTCLYCGGPVVTDRHKRGVRKALVCSNCRGVYCRHTDKRATKAAA